MAIMVFGFGSLMNTESLRATVPDAFDITPSYIKGFMRDFSVWDAAGFTESNLDIAGFAYCAVDLKKVTEPQARVNGVTFSMSDTHFENLIKREHDYELVKAPIYDFLTNESLGECFLFSSNKNNGQFDFDSPAQKRYLQICLRAAEQYGEQFYHEFLHTTFIGKRRLSEVPELSKLQLI